MKNFLAVSLHRLGDLIMHGHVLRSLALEREIKIHLFTHPFYQKIDFLFPFVERVFLFEREWCQKSIGENFLNKAWPYRHIQQLLETLSQTHYDNVMDFSQTETSARWMSFMRAHQKNGICYDPSLSKKEFCSDNPWIHYLHQQPHSQIHFIDLFKKTLDLPVGGLPKRSEACLNSKLIVFQTQSSDQKKNWPLAKWVLLIQKMRDEFPEFEYCILSSASEFAFLEKAFSCLGSSVSLRCTDIRESYDLLQRSRLLITLDTSIKHLASWAGTPIIELSLGSSNPNETGAYQEGALIVKTPAACSPCRHSQSCSQNSYVCHEQLMVESVLAAVHFQLIAKTSDSSVGILEKQTKLLKKFMKNVSHYDQILNSIFHVSSSVEGGWRSHPILELDYFCQGKETMLQGNDAYFRR